MTSSQKKTRGTPRRKGGFREGLKGASLAFKKGKIDVTFLILILLILVTGLIMLFSASFPFAYYNEGNSYHFILRQAMWALMGVVGMIAISYFDYHLLRKLIKPMVIVTFLLMFVPRIYPPTKGVYRWIYLGSFSFQPSEIAKFVVIVLFAHLLAKNYAKIQAPVSVRFKPSDSASKRRRKNRWAKIWNELKYGVVPFFLVFAVVIAQMMLQKHLSGTILILLIGFVLMFVGGTPLKYFAVGGGFAAAALTYVVFFTDILTYATSRLEGWLDPTLDITGTTFQTYQSLLAIASGGLMGTGFGASRQKYLYVPEPQNDFIFSIICEELGFIGAVAVVLLFVLLVWRGFVIALHAKDRFGALLAVGLVFQVGLQAMLNIAVVTNTIPNTGISLPFFSYGGTSLVMLLWQMGLVLSVSRFSRLEKT